MIEEDIQSLLDVWRDRLKTKQPKEYKIALSECILEVESLSSPSIKDDYWNEIFQSQELVEIND